MGWTDERVEILKKLWLEGLSASQIAKQLGGVTRSVVIGKVARLGLTGRATPSAPAKTARVTSLRPPKPTSELRKLLGMPSGQPKAPAPTVPAVEDLSFARPWFERAARQCAWPIGEPSDAMLSCCAPTEEGETYCPAHTARLRQPAQNKNDAKALARSLRRFA